VPLRFIQPCNPIRAKEVPAGDGWLHEVKFDGYRVQVHKVGSRVVIYSRNGHDFLWRGEEKENCPTYVASRCRSSVSIIWRPSHPQVEAHPYALLWGLLA
jgi:bifunctional non-homologous end joining protein LigD